MKTQIDKLQTELKTLQAALKQLNKLNDVLSNVSKAKMHIQAEIATIEALIAKAAQS